MRQKIFQLHNQNSMIDAFELDKDIVFFDIEATGLHVIRDRIMQIGMIKYFADGRSPEEKEMLINPGIPIKEDALAVHGIYPEDVANKPIFSQVAEELLQFFGEADLSGYNLMRFDIPMLMEEFHRAGHHFSIENRRVVDVQRIFYKMEPRTFAAAHRFYCGEEMEGAHDALSDVKATVNVLKGQISAYKDVDYTDKDGKLEFKPVQNDIKKLHEFTNDLNVLDATQKLKRNNDGEVAFNFGKYNNKSVREVMEREPNYIDWMINKDFSVQVKEILKQEKKKFNA